MRELAVFLPAVFCGLSALSAFFAGVFLPDAFFAAAPVAFFLGELFAGAFLGEAAFFGAAVEKMDEKNRQLCNDLPLALVAVFFAAGDLALVVLALAGALKKNGSKNAARQKDYYFDNHLPDLVAVFFLVDGDLERPRVAGAISSFQNRESDNSQTRFTFHGRVGLGRSCRNDGYELEKKEETTIMERNAIHPLTLLGGSLRLGCGNRKS